jgi:release factor glutamine methyltransferase
MSTSIRTAITEASSLLVSAGVNEARREAMSLMSFVLECDRAFLFAHSEDDLSESQLKEFRLLSSRRANREPLQYITGHQEFFNLNFEVTPDVLVPRPETEILVEAALEVLEGDAAPFIADIGTGSGCIIVSLLHEIPLAHAIGTDLSLNALRIAQKNARRHNVNDRLALVQADGFPVTGSGREFSLIVSNPPYVTESEFAGLQPEVREYEPRTALVSGADGLSHIRTLLRGAPAHLRGGGHFIFEIGFGQRDAVERLVDQEQWNLIEVRKDLQGIPRTVILRKR